MADIIGAILIIVTAILTDKASEKWKKWCWALFVLLVLAQAGLQIKGKRADETKAQSQEKELSGQHTDIQNLMGELQKSETQRQVDNAMLRTKLEDYSQLSQLGPALMKLAETSAEFQKKQYEAKVLSDQALYDLTMKSVRDIRAFSKKYSDLELEREQQETVRAVEKVSDAERQQRWAKRINQSIQDSYAKQQEFETSVLPDATYARNELLRRKLPEPPLDPFQRSEVNMVLRGALAGVDPELALAQYLEQMAKPLAQK